MRESLALSLLLLLTSCWGPTSRDLPSDQEAIDHFKQHKELFEQIKYLALATSEYKSDQIIQKLLREADCKDIRVDRSKRIVVTYFTGGTILAGSTLDYIYMDPFYNWYGDSIHPHEDLRTEVYKSPLHEGKVKSLGGGWYLCLSVE